MIQEYYAHRGTFPADNEALGLPPAEHLRGQYVTGITISYGSIEVTFTQEVDTAELQDGKLIDVPCINVQHPASPILWRRFTPPTAWHGLPGQDFTRYFGVDAGATHFEVEVSAN